MKTLMRAYDSRNLYKIIREQALALLNIPLI